MPMLGIMASAASGNLWAPGKDFDSIATVTPYTTTTTVVFSSIPATYRHLQLRASAAASAAANITIRLNGVTSGDYSWHYVEGSGSATSTGNGANQTSMLGPVVTSTGSMYTGIIMDILDYAGTNKNKTVYTLAGVDLNGTSTWLNVFSGALYNSPTSPISSITVTLSGATFAANSRWALYGIK